MSLEQKYKDLKKEVENAKAEAERARGAYTQIKAQLEAEFGCKTIKEAKLKLAKLQDKVQSEEKELEKMIEAYEKKWKKE